MPALSKDELQIGMDLAERMLARKLTRDEERVFIFAVGYGGGTADAKRRGVNRARPQAFKFKPY